MILLSLHKRVRYLVENAIVLCFFHVCDIESYPWCIISGWIILNVKISWDLNMKFYLLLCLQDEIDLILLSTVYYHLLKQLLHTEMDKKPFALNFNFFFFFVKWLLFSTLWNPKLTNYIKMAQLPFSFFFLPF